MNEVSFQTHRSGADCGVGNGDHHFPAEFDTDTVALFYGKAMLIVRTEEGRGGAIRIEAKSPALRPAGVSVRSGR